MRAATVFNFLVESTLMGSVMILLMLAVRRFLRPKLGSRVLCLAWLLVAIRLLVPLALPNPVMNEIRPDLSGNFGVRPIADQLRVRMIDAAYDAANLLDGTEYRSTGAARVISDFGAETSYGHTARWFLLGYAAVALLVLGHMIIQNIRFLRSLEKSIIGTLDGEALRALETISRQRRVSQVSAFWADPLPSACLVGLIRPRILLPLTVNPREIPYVLSHELCHQKAEDNWWGLLRNLCCVVHWFNPLVWLAARMSRMDQEMACDERVTAQLEDEERIAYANTLAIEAARRQAPRMAVLATGMTMKGREIKRRIRAIVDHRAAVAWLCAAALMIAGAGTLFSFGTAEVLPQLPILSIPALEGEMVQLRSISNQQEAIEYARSLLASAPYLNGPLSAYDTFDMLDWTAIHAPETDVWRVETQPVQYTLTFSGEGRLYSIIDIQAQHMGDGRGANPSYRTDASAREPLYDYARGCAKILMPDFVPGSMYIDADYYAGATRYVTVRSQGDETCYFYLTVEPTLYLVEIYRYADHLPDAQNELYRVRQELERQQREYAIQQVQQASGIAFLAWDEIAPDSVLAMSAITAYNHLTEVYGYTTEKADTFRYALSETPQGTCCLCIDPDLPQYPYAFSLSDPIGTALSPYAQSNVPVSEAGLRYFLDLVDEGYWLRSWGEADRKAFVNQAADELCEIKLPADAIRRILSGECTPQEAVRECFTAVYGEPDGWNEALTAWYQHALSINGCVDI